MKKVLLAISMISFAGLYSCDSNKTETSETSGDTTVTSQFGPNDSSYADSGDHNNSITSGTMNSNVQLDAASIDFVSKAASGSMMEVELGNLAGQKASSQRVKNFGAMMVTDHSAAANELKALFGANVPAAMLPEHQQHVTMMNSKSGSAFDKAYMNMMVEDHKKDIAEFKKATEALPNDMVKAFANKTLPVLQKHLDSAKAIAGKL
jgi:putative membrane protein